MKHTTELLAAVNILLLFEVRKCSRSGVVLDRKLERPVFDFIQQVLAFRELGWQSHYKELIQLLLARGPRANADDMS
jgi:hypothetical protein